MAPSNSNKKRTTKGKPLSEALREKDEKKAAEAAELEADLAEERAKSQSAADASDEASAAADAGDSDDDDGESDSDEASDADLDDETAEREEEGTDDDSDEDEAVAAALGHERYVVMGFVVAGLLLAYVLGRALRDGWGDLAALPKFVQLAPQLASIPAEGELISRSTISLLVGAIAAAFVVIRYYRSADAREWANEVADEVSKVKWPTRKEIGNYTVIVIAGSALLTAYLTLLDRFWAFVTNLIYSTGA